MLQKCALPFYNIGQVLEAVYDVTAFSIDNENDLLDGKDIARIRADLQEAIGLFEVCGLKLSILAIKDLIIQPDEYFTNYNIKSEISELGKRVQHELSFVDFYYVSEDRVLFYNSEFLLGKKVADSFPSSGFDIEEAGKCLALGRSTSCVFHLMRAMEMPLRLLGEEVGILNAPNWNKLLQDIEKLFTDIKTKKYLNQKIGKHTVNRFIPKHRRC